MPNSTSRSTASFGMPKTQAGAVDKRYSHPAPLTNSGQRDMRTTPMHKKG